MTDYKVNFQDLKAKVGIDDVAYALGYRLDRKAGVGRYMELVLGDGKEKRDALVICHPQDKASQRFFRRDGSKGDVVTLIRENLNAFNVSGKDEWQKIAKVLSRFANMPEPEYREDREYVQSVRYHATFDSSRYEVACLHDGCILEWHFFAFAQRGKRVVLRQVGLFVESQPLFVHLVQNQV